MHSFFKLILRGLRAKIITKTQFAYISKFISQILKSCAKEAYHLNCFSQADSPLSRREGVASFNVTEISN